jgi:spore maturation protein CgeB
MQHGYRKFVRELTQDLIYKLFIDHGYIVEYLLKRLSQTSTLINCFYLIKYKVKTINYNDIFLRKNFFC